MTQKICGILAIAASLICVLTMGGHVGNVKAYERTCHYWSSGYSQCEPGDAFSYTQPNQATIHQVDCDYGWDCCKTNQAACNSVIEQPQITQTTFFPNSPDTNNCFWSYPVQCQPN